ncbi:DUF3570 domain-containing protein [Candidatus Methylocalor cossyra]|uniref:DUF3570 domain-containing protein n=1 Tax=Candidatus Methylocalor cossyra TaxID=3108543 RepID=UPI0032B2D874
MAAIDPEPPCGQDPKRGRDSALQALTRAALALPGLLLSAAQADDTSFQYGHYQETSRDLFGIKSAFKPIEVETLQSLGNLTLSERIKFAFHYIQDTWGGATPITTAPLAFQGNRPNNTFSGATPFIQNTNVYFDQNLTPLVRDPLTGTFAKDARVVHTLSSASPETRRQGDFKLDYEWDEAALTIGGGLSVEHDYQSRFGSLAGRWDFNQKLTTLNVGLSYTNSTTSALMDHDAAPYIETSTFGQRVEFTPDGQRFIHGRRQDWASYLSLTQVLNKNSLIEAGVGYTRSTGYMANPYKVMEVAFIDPRQRPGPDGVLRGELLAFLEQRPEVRNQWTANLRYVVHLAPLDAALHLGYGFFHDDWGIDAHTLEAEWSQPLGDGWTLTPRIRYYSQDAANFYRPYLISRQSAAHYDPKRLPRHYSSDQRLSGFGALSGGIVLSKTFAKGVSLEAGAEYYAHAGDLKLGGDGEGAYTNFDYYAVNAALKIDFSAISSAALESPGGHAHHPDHGRHGGRAPAGVMFDHMLSRPGEFMVGYRYMYAHQTGTMLHGAREVGDSTLVAAGCRGQPCYVTPTKMDMNMHMLMLMYAPTDWLNLMLMPQFMDMNMTMRPLKGAPPVDLLNDPGTAAAVLHANHEHFTGGVGDTGLFAMFKLFERPGHRLIATLGVSAPTGAVDVKLRRTHQQNLGFIHYGMQLGSGTWDFKPSLTYTGEHGAWSWGAQLSGTKRLNDRNDSGYALGDLFQSTVWGSYDLLDWLSASVRGVYTSEGPIRGAYRGIFYPIGPMDYPANYGGHYWDVGFGLSATVLGGDLKGNRLSFEWLQPVHDDVNGYQLPRDGALSASWSYAF